MFKICFVIIASKNQPWEGIYQTGQLQTWLNDLGDSEQYIAAYSDDTLGASRQKINDHRKIEFSRNSTPIWKLSEPQFFSRNQAQFASYEGFGGIIPTTLSAINFALNTYDPDFIIRTNVSSYWNLNVLKSKLSNLPKTSFYGGVPGPMPRSLTRSFKSKFYASGAGIFMSSDVARLIVSNFKSLDLSMIDDLAIADFMHSQKVPICAMTRFDLNNVDEVQNLDERILSSTYHYRCKAGTSVRFDADIMRTLNIRLNK